MTRSYALWLEGLLVALTLMTAVGFAWAQESTMTPEQRQALAEQGDEEAAAPTRPAKLPDLTKGHTVKERERQDTWHLGPTGIIGYMPGGLKGDQIEVTSVLAGSPAEGQLRWGDVILGVNGENFVAGGNMGLIFGNAIIESEKEANGGILKLRVWRDANFGKRNGKKDVAGVDVDELIEGAADDVTLYDWKPEDEQEREVRNENFEAFPIEAAIIEVTLELEVMPPYSDTSPYDCPKAAKIRENAWQVLAKQFVPDERGRGGRGGTLQAVALAASGKQEYLQLLREWVRSPRGKIWHPPTEPDDPLNLPGKSWYMSFTGLECALYYDATGDEFVLPALERFAVRTAKGQSGAGSWGHGWAQPSFNGGQYHGMNPGYGALNTSGNRCFFLIVLAKKLGIENPEIDAAIERSRRFFGSYVDKGAIPYGHHGAWPSDDSNGKNSGVAFALMLLGDKHGAKYFAQMSTHASFTRRGGHGHDWFWHWSPWAATICGPRGTIASHRNLRWWFTLCRRFDGGFVIHSPTGAKQLRDATATYALHYSAPLKQTLITGKDADESYWWTDEAFGQLLASARGQFWDPQLIEQAGTPWPQRSTDELFKLLDVFKPKTRAAVARELAKRYAEGEKDILPRLAALLASDEPRFREAACIGLAACGRDATLQYMSGVARLLLDKPDFVRMQAVRTMALVADMPETQAALLKATAVEDTRLSMSPNSLPAITQKVLFGNDSTLATRPFEAGFDAELVRGALEKLITLDPTGNRPMIGSRKKIWDRDTVAHVAGPLVFAAEEEQIADQMFSSRRPVSIELLERLAYEEAVDAAASYLRKYENLPRDLRPRVSYKRGVVAPKTLMRHPEAARRYLDSLKVWLLDKPLDMALVSKEEPDIPLYELVDQLEATTGSSTLASLGKQAEDLFNQELAKVGDETAKRAYCRNELADPDRPNFFRQMAAMSYLVGTLGGDALGDILPYLDHAHWRVRDRARGLAVDLAAGDGGAALIDAFAKADEGTAVGILAVLSKTKSDGGRKLARAALADARPRVQAAAIETLAAITGEQAIEAIFQALADASDAVVLRSCEKALLAIGAEPTHRDGIRRQAIAMLADSPPELRGALYWILGQLGGSESLAVLKEASTTEDDRQFRDVVTALSYHPDPAADAVMLGIIKANAKTPRAELAASEGIRRMLVSPAGIGKRPIDEQLDYAEAVLEMELNGKTIAYLGRIHTGRCAYILQRAMRRGAPASAAQAIIVATADLSKAPEADRKLAVSALIDTIEFIEVTYLRGGATERLEKNPEAWRTYAKWKSISTQAGKNLLKLDRTDKAPLPTFDDLDLDM